MNIEKPYRLPNCTLTLEGLGNGDSAQTDLQILLNARCQFVGLNTPLEGGRTFLEALAKGVNAYAQECLSGIHHPRTTQGESGEWAELTPLPDQGLHRLTWHPPTEESVHPVTLDLTTVQLFDLVEAIDQFVADRHTLPDFSLTLEPLSRRHRPPDEPFVQRALPPTLGTLVLALCAALLYGLPLPEVRKPEPKTPAPPALVDPSSPAPNGSAPTP